MYYILPGLLFGAFYSMMHCNQHATTAMKRLTSDTQSRL